MGTFIGHRVSGINANSNANNANNVPAASSLSGVQASYASGYGHSGYGGGGCCCCEKEAAAADSGGSFLDDNAFLALLGLGAAAVFFLNMQITMTKKRRRSLGGRSELVEGGQVNGGSIFDPTDGSVSGVFNALISSGK